jgi:hypothetical protein
MCHRRGAGNFSQFFTPQTSYAMVGYNGAATQAAGQGTARIIHPTTGSVEDTFFVYVPSIKGTNVYLEHQAKTHPTIYPWTQETTPASKSGQVTFIHSMMPRIR